jgi:hypothetical protein
MGAHYNKGKNMKKIILVLCLLTCSTAMAGQKVVRTDTVSPTLIDPELGDATASSLTIDPGTDPGITSTDSDAPGTDKEVGSMLWNYNSGGDGSEESSSFWSVFVGGVSTIFAECDGPNERLEIKKDLICEESMEVSGVSNGSIELRLAGQATGVDGNYVAQPNLSGDYTEYIYNNGVKSVFRKVKKQSTLVASWALSDDGTWADQTDNGNTLTELGVITATAGHGGGPSKAADGFGAGNFLYMATAGTGTDITGSITVSAWVKPTAGGGATIGKWITGGNTAWLLYVGSTTPIFTMTPDGSTPNFATSSVNVPNGSWSFIAGKYDGIEITIWVNGVKTGTTAYTSGIYSYPSQGLRVGSALSVLGDGAIDDIRVFSGSDVDILTLFLLGDEFE